jgi:hypothetical protein
VNGLASLKPYLPPLWVARGRCVLRGLPVPRWGNLRRLAPFSASFGFDRGIPVDRFYLNAFLHAHAADIHGDVLEIQMPAYTRRFGRSVTLEHSVDILPEHRATYTCDLAHSEAVIPSNRYDCFLLPNTLSMLRDLDGCLRHALRVVKPGGVILAATPTLGQLLPDVDGDYWRLTVAGWREVAQRAWPGCDVSITAYGNVLAATAALQGLAVEELTRSELEAFDPRFPVLVCLRCRKREAV